MQWYKIRFTQDEVAAGESNLLTDQFVRVCTDLGSPKGMVLLSETNAVDDKYIIYYLNSIALSHSREIKDIYSATPCSIPTGKNLHLVFGDSSQLNLN